MSSFTAWSPALWSPALLSLGQPLAKAGYMERLMRFMVVNGTDERVLALHTEVTTLATVKLAGESDESAYDVVVYGMVPSSLVSRPAACEGWFHGEVDAFDESKRHRRACLGVAH